MAVEDLLSRLETVRSTAPAAWSSRCPAHADKSPSLAIRELTDGRILVHCFAGCGAADVMGAIGLELSALFPEALGQFKAVRQPFTAVDALRALSHEAAIVAIVSSDIVEGKPVGNDSADRVALAAGRIADALEYIHAA